MLFCRSINRDILSPVLTYNTSGLLVQALVLKSLNHAICYLFKKLQSVFTPIEFNSKNNGPVLLFKTICILKLFPVVCCYGWDGWMWIET